MKKSMVFEGVAVILLILLSFLMLAMVLSGTEKQVPGVGELGHTLAGSDDTLYTFSGDRVSAIGKDGSLLWTYKAPAQWRICDYGLYTEQDPYLLPNYF